ncbi:MAG: hypothetical protein H0W13_10575 [Nitrospirales bacterium]|nr:hypothetical protein [Nitrospirales bacterium]
MNTYYSGRSSRPAGLFSFGLLDGPPWITVSRTGRLTNSPARTDVTLFIHRAVRPARSLRELARPSGTAPVLAGAGSVGETLPGGRVK